MTNCVAKVTEEWGEVGFGSRKREGYLWEVEYFLGGEQIDKSIHRDEKIARGYAERFETGDWKYSEWQGVDFNV